jgi:hypothetical protein
MNHHLARRCLRRACVVLLIAAPVAAIATVAAPQIAGANTATYTSTEIGSSGQTPQFNQSGNWQLAWSYNCTAFGSPGNFGVEINNSAADVGPNELGTGGSGTDYYTDTGNFSLSVTSECDWSITVSPSSAPPPSSTATYTSTQIGSSGETPSFDETGPWQMAWSYDCTAFGSPGNFSVNINNSATDIGPNELGMGGSGTDNYTDAGTFSLTVISECDWSITISATGSSPPPSPPPAPAPAAPKAVGIASAPGGGGYWIAWSNGNVTTHGDANNYGNVSGLVLNAPITHIVSTPDGHGYWLVAADGGTFAEGDAGFYGSMGGQHLNAPVVDMAPTPNGGGYWLVASDGGIFAFGNAPFYGSMGGQHLNKPVVGISADDASGGYWEVASDGGIFAFGAPFYGSTGSLRLNEPVNGMTALPNGDGYLFVASDGGIFAFNAPFYGSMGGQPLNAPIVGMALDPATDGYWLLGADGGVFSFNAPFWGAY